MAARIYESFVGNDHGYDHDAADSPQIRAPPEAVKEAPRYEVDLGTPRQMSRGWVAPPGSESGSTWLWAALTKFGFD